MGLVPFILASLAGRGAIFFTVGVLFRIFGAPIKAFIDKYLGWVTAAFVVLVVGGVLVLTQLGGSEDENGGPCSASTAVKTS